MGTAQARTERREIRRAVGEQGLAAFDRVGQDTERLRSELRVQIGRLHLIIGKTTDQDLARPIMGRLDVLDARVLKIENALADVFLIEKARDRSFWTRMRWLLTGK
jgi:hypothetical protein